VVIFSLKVLPRITVAAAAAPAAEMSGFLVICSVWRFKWLGNAGMDPTHTASVLLVPFKDTHNSG